MSAGLLQFGTSLAAVLALIALAWAMGFRQSARLDSEDDARDLFRLMPGGFEPVAIGVDRNGEAAIAEDANGRLAILIPHGNQFVARPIDRYCLSPGENGVLTARLGRKKIALHLEEDVRRWTATDSSDN